MEKECKTLLCENCGAVVAYDPHCLSKGETTFFCHVCGKYTTLSLKKEQKLSVVLDSLENLLLEKRKNYGDSAINPVRIFSKHEPDNGICIRLDDKLARISNSTEGLRKNDVVDIMGYLTLLCEQKDWTDFSDLID